MLYSAFAARFEQYADHILIEEDGGARFTYADIAGLAAQIDGALRALGVVPGDRVLAQIEKSPHAFALYLACLRAGAIYVPLNTDYTEAELAYFLGDAEPRVVVAAPSAEGLFTRLAAAHPSIRVRTLAGGGTGSLLSERHTPMPPASRNTDDLAAILYTSGTTGKPKGAMLSHGNLLSNAETLVSLWRFSPSDTLIHALPIYHVHGLFVACHCALLSGATMIFLPKFDGKRILALMARASVLMGVPTFYTRLLSEPALNKESVRHMRLFIAGSAPLSPETFKEFETRTGHTVLERYGMTETGMLCSNPYDGARIAGSVGFPLPGVELRIADAETGNPCETGAVGIVEVKGPNIFKGYWRNPEKTAAEFRPDGYFITGDMGLRDQRGYVHLVGRAKDLVITGGLNVYPAEVEALLDAIPGIAESAVIGVPHADLGEGVVAVVRIAEGTLDEEAIRTTLRRDLAGFKVPKRVIALPELPRNSMGKVQKNILRASYVDLLK